ncbi:MAG: glycoside hydrolase family 3 protein [Anaerolineae bacterium]|jgi:beta-N-acetylhexosaminidase|nr:glycoside hydrolase family 3 protein [Anaerolineae bacterium]
MVKRKIALVAVLWALLAGRMPLAAQNATPDDLLARMSLAQKVGQMFMFTFYGRPVNEPARDFIATWQPGFVALLPSNLGNPEQVTNLTNSVQQTLLDAGSLPAFIATDQEGGIIQHLEEGFTQFPVPMLLTATGDTALAYRYGAGLAAELRAVGINMNLAPVVDLNTNRRNPIIGRRSPGDDPQQVGAISAALIQGMQAGGVLATAKHFPGHGDTADDSHTTLPVVPLPLERLLAVELLPFVAARDAGAGAIMVAHIWYPALEAEPNRPASLSHAIVTGLLRGQLGYNGLILPDAMDMDAIDTVYSPAAAALEAVAAGHDVILPGAHVSPAAHAAAITAVIAAVEAGDIPLSRIDDSVRRILAAKIQFGLPGWQPLPAAGAAERVPLEDNVRLIEEVFRAGVTVVYDEAGLLPLDGDTAVIYPGSQPSLWTACNLRPGLRPLAVAQSPAPADISAAVWTAQQSRRVLVFVRDAEQDAAQQALVAALPPEKTVVVALQSPYDALALPRTGAYVVTYSPLKPAFAAVCGVLFGDLPARGQPAVRLTP